MCGLAANQAWHQFQGSLQTTQAAGTVEKMSSTGEGPDRKFDAVISFVDASGAKHTVDTGPFHRAQQPFTVGDTADVQYPPQAPEEAQLLDDRDSLWGPLFIFGIGALFALVGWSFVRARFTKAGRQSMAKSAAAAARRRKPSTQKQWHRDRRIMAGVAAVPALIGVGLAANTLIFIQRATKTQGTVVNLVGSSSGDSEAAVVRYTDSQSHSREFRTSSTNFISWTLGEKTDVLYLPQNPGDVCVDSFFGLWLAPLVLFVIAGVIGGTVYSHWNKPAKGTVEPDPNDPPEALAEDGPKEAADEAR
ncbi:MAG: DUF3592 domain-containing protein [Planctomycetota bacterium]